MPKDYFRPEWFKTFNTGGLTEDILRQMQEQIERQTADAPFGVGDGRRGASRRDDYNWGSDTTMKDLNARSTLKKRKAPQVEVYAVQSRDGRHANIQVLVPNAFGTHEPLCDGETGQPVDFFADFGDPRRWTKNMGPEIEAAAKRAAATCAKLMAKRMPA